MRDDKALPKLKNNNQANKVKGSNSPRGDALSSAPLPLMDMYRGYFPLWRKITDWGWYKDSNTKSVFIHLLLKVNRKKKDYLGYIIYPGQCVTGRKSLSVELGLSERQVRTALKHLKATNEITINANSKFSIITLTNYRKYLPKEYYNSKKATSEKSSKRPASDQQATTTNKDKKDNKDNNSKRGFRPPTLKEVSNYCKERKNNVDPKKFYDFFTVSNWIDSKGNKVKSWKQKVITWEKYSGNDKKKEKTTSKYDNIGKEV